MTNVLKDLRLAEARNHLPQVAVTRIDSIEFAQREGGEDVCLCLREGPETKVLRGIDVTDELCEVTLGDEGRGSNAI